MAAAGDVPTIEILAAISILREHMPDLKIRMINVVDLMRLQPQEEHPHGLSDRAFDVLFTTDKPIIFAYHGYPWLIHRLTYRRTNHHNLHVRGYKEEGTTTTPFDMLVRNDMDRFHLVDMVIDRVPKLGPGGGLRPPGGARQADRPQGVHRQVRPGHAGDPQLDLARRQACVRHDLIGSTALNRGGSRAARLPSCSGSDDANREGGRPAAPARNGARASAGGAERGWQCVRRHRPRR